MIILKKFNTLILLATLFLIVATTYFVFSYLYYVHIPSKMAKTPAVEHAIKMIQIYQQYGDICYYFDTGYFGFSIINNCTNTAGEIWKQDAIIKKLVIQERMDFYSLLIANIDLDTPSVEVIAVLYDVLDEDMVLINQYLIEFQNTARFDEFNNSQKERFKDIAEGIKALAESLVYINKQKKWKNVAVMEIFGIIAGRVA